MIYNGDGNAVPNEDKRIGHADRDRYADHLAAMVSTGHLKQDEFSERRDKVLEATHLRDLTALTRDLPAVPGPPRPARVRQQVSGGRFHPWLWVSSMAFGLAVITLPAPVMSAEYGGFDHTPLGGAAAIMIILAGVIAFVVGGVALSPDGQQYGQ